MKQLITLCLAVFFIAGTQHTQAQTKEETIQWLNDYGKKIDLSSQKYEEKTSYNFSGFDGEFLSFKIETIDYDSGKILTIQVQKFKVLPKDILFQEISILDKNAFILKAKSGTIFHSYKGESKHNNYRAPKIDGKSEFERKTEDIYFQFNHEETKDALRLFKAIMHLAKLSGADELPKVTEDTF